FPCSRTWARAVAQSRNAVAHLRPGRCARRVHARARDRSEGVTTMLTDTGIGRQLFELLVESLDIPSALYERAVSRHRSLGEWLCRDASRLRAFNPHVSSQGSFRYGTVVPPLVLNAEY